MRGLSLLSFFLCIVSCYGDIRTVKVGNSTSADYPSIFKAVTSGNDDLRILLAPGQHLMNDGPPSYRDDGRSLEFDVEDQTVETYIDLSQNSLVLWHGFKLLSFSNVELRYAAFKIGAIENFLLFNLTIRQGSLYLDSFPVFEVKDSTANITNVVFQNLNQNTGMYAYNTTLNVKGLQINNCSYGGFGLYAYTVATIEDVIMTSSTSDTYGALASGEASTVTLRNIFATNVTAVDLIEFSTTTIEIYNCTIIYCTQISGLQKRQSAVTAAGLIFISSANNTIVDGLYMYNNQHDQGSSFSAIHNTGAMMTNSVFDSNSGMSGAVIIQFSELKMSNTIIRNCQAQMAGGVRSDASELIIYNTTIEGNNARQGGGIYASHSNVTLTSCSVAHNTANDSPDTYLFASFINSYSSAGDTSCCGTSSPLNCGASCCNLDCLSCGVQEAVYSVVDCDAVNSKPSRDRSSLSAGGIAGIVIACVFIVGVLIGVVVWQYISKKELKKRFEMESLMDLNMSVYLSDIQMDNVIGAGHFGTVYRGTWNGTTTVACKQLKQGMDDRKEVGLLMKLNHPNIVRFLGVFIDQKEAKFMVLEFCPLGSLCDFLQWKPNAEQLVLQDRLAIAFDIASGMIYLHSCGIIHRDLGARNVLLEKTGDRYVAKISDFGLSKQSSQYYEAGSTIAYKWSAPEMIAYGKSNAKSDVWSYGVTLWEMMTNGLIPYQGLSNAEAVELVKSGQRLPQPDECPDILWDHILSCWNSISEERPNFTECAEQLRLMMGKEEKDDINPNLLVQSSHYQTEMTNTNIVIYQEHILNEV